MNSDSLDLRQAVVPAAGRHLTVADSRRAWAAEFRAAGIDTAELDARVLVGHALSLDHAALAARAAQVLTPQQQSAIGALARRRLGDEPVARITGTKDFWTLRLRVNEAEAAQVRGIFELSSRRRWRRLINAVRGRAPGVSPISVPAAARSC